MSLKRGEKNRSRRDFSFYDNLTTVSFYLVSTIPTEEY